LPKGVDVETATTLQQNTPTPAPMIQAINANNLTNQMSEAGVSQGQINLDASFSESLRQSSLDKINTLMQVKDHFQNMLKNQQTHLKINLIPQDLGGIEITIDFSKETVMATLIRAERRETMELLAKHAQDINQLFHEAGLQANLADMNFTSDQDLSQNLHENTSPYAVSLQMDIEDEQALQEDIDPDALVDIKA
jgi:flagellar hook-length control protein FliK